MIVGIKSLGTRLELTEGEHPTLRTPVNPALRGLHWTNDWEFDELYVEGC